MLIQAIEDILQCRQSVHGTRGLKTDVQDSSADSSIRGRGTSSLLEVPRMSVRWGYLPALLRRFIAGFQLVNVCGAAVLVLCSYFGWLKACE